MNIIEFIRDSQLIAGDLSPYQETALRLLYGLPLSPEQRTTAGIAAGREKLDQREFNEATFICGRRSGIHIRLLSLFLPAYSMDYPVGVPTMCPTQN